MDDPGVRCNLIVHLTKWTYVYTCVTAEGPFTPLSPCTNVLRAQNVPRPLLSTPLDLKAFIPRLDSHIKSKSLNNTYLNIIKIFNKLLKKIIYLNFSMLVNKILILWFRFDVATRALYSKWISILVNIKN